MKKPKKPATERAKNAEFDRALGARIRAQREDMGLKQVEIARLMHKQSSDIHRYELGSMSIRPRTLVMIAQALSTTPSDLLRGIEA